MAKTCKYYKQRRYVSYNNGQTWQALDEYRKGSLYEEGSEDCLNEIVKMYQWRVVSGEYVCSGTTKYEKTQRYVSYDSGATWSAVTPSEYSTGQVLEQNSEDCGYIEPQYRWLALSQSEYICSGTTKYTKEKKQVSNDNGTTWTDVYPEETRIGSIIEENSTDCGYVEPIYRWSATSGYICLDCEDPSKELKMIAYLSDYTPHYVYSNGSTTLTKEEVRSGDYSNYVFVEIFSSVTEIYTDAFLNCQKLERILLPTTEIAISPYSFRNCIKLERLESWLITEIGYHAFENCDSFELLVLGYTVPELYGDALYGSFDIYVPQSCVNKYKNKWTNYSSRIIGY